MYERLLAWTVRLLVVLFLAVVAYWGWLWYQQGQITRKITETESKIASQKTEIGKDKDRQELLVRQTQLAELDKLMKGHLYWSRLMPQLADVTLKKASYVSFKGLSDGSLTLSVIVPTSADMDKFLQVFDLPKINKHFANLKIGPINRVQSGDSLAMRFEVKVDYDPSLLRYPVAESKKDQ